MRVLRRLIMSGRIIIIPSSFSPLSCFKHSARCARCCIWKYCQHHTLRHAWIQMFNWVSSVSKHRNWGVKLHFIYGVCIGEIDAWNIRRNAACVNKKMQSHVTITIEKNTSQSKESKKNPISILIRFVKHTQCFVCVNESDVGTNSAVFFFILKRYNCVSQTFAFHSSPYNVG